MEMGRKLFGSLKSLVFGREITSAFFFFKDSWEDVVKNR